MLNLTKLVIKNDLHFELTKEETSFFETMDEREVRAIRKNIIKNIRDGILPIDVLEEALEGLKDIQYKIYLSSEGSDKDIEEQTLYLEEIEGNCSRMIINLANDNSSVYDLLGPNIHDTYGINVKK